MLLVSFGSSPRSLPNVHMELGGHHVSVWFALKISSEIGAIGKQRVMAVVQFRDPGK